MLRLAFSFFFCLRSTVQLLVPALSPFVVFMMMMMNQICVSLRRVSPSYSLHRHRMTHSTVLARDATDHVERRHANINTDKDGHAYRQRICLIRSKMRMSHPTTGVGSIQSAAIVRSRPSLSRPNVVVVSMMLTVHHRRVRAAIPSLLLLTCLRCRSTRIWRVVEVDVSFRMSSKVRYRIKSVTYKRRWAE